MAEKINAYRINVTESVHLEDLGVCGRVILKWNGRVQRMEEGRLPKGVMKWSPPGRRKRGRPKLNWTEGIRGLMGEKGLMEKTGMTESNWRKKII